MHCALDTTPNFVALLTFIYIAVPTILKSHRAIMLHCLVTLHLVTRYLVTMHLVTLLLELWCSLHLSALQSRKKGPFRKYFPVKIHSSLNTLL